MKQANIAKFNANKKPLPVAIAKQIMQLEPVEIMTDEELIALPAGSVMLFDVEVYVNYFCVCFRSLVNNKHVYFEISPDTGINLEKLAWVMWKFCLVGFNIINYDLLILEAVFKLFSTARLKEVSDFIIKSEKVRARDVFDRYNLKVKRYNVIDLIEVAPLQGSLKLYGARLHATRLQDLPFHESTALTKDEAAIVLNYCFNDLDLTKILFEELAQEIQLRVEMSQQYKVDLRSKSDAQVAEAVIASELKKILGKIPFKPSYPEGYKLQYQCPHFIEFVTPKFNKAMQDICAAEFGLDWEGKPEWPEGLGEKIKTEKGYKWEYVLEFNGKFYKLGMGGIHSQEKLQAHFATDEIEIADNDVESFYPRIILNQKLFPVHLGEAFLIVYEAIVNRRIDAKSKAKALKACDAIAAAGYKSIADSLKIVINGSFGKLGNKYSILYAPQLMLQVTITGQLVLLMLIEALELAGIEVISANTDGIISKYHKSRRPDVRHIISMWEKHTQFKTEETLYDAVLSRDVNAYLAVKSEGGDDKARFLDEKVGVKSKGAFCERGSALNSVLSKNPETLICNDAVILYIKNGTPLETTIKNCKDIRRFTSVRNVKGGGQKDGVILGKVVRWYYAKNESGYIAYVSSGNKVAKTDGAKPLMKLPESFPNDIDYDWYIKEAVEMLYDLGKLKTIQNMQLF